LLSIEAVEEVRNQLVASPMDRVRRELMLPTGPDRVWSALTRPGEVSAWFGADVIELDPYPGGQVRFRWRDGWERGAVVEEVEVPRRWVFRWLPFSRTPEGETRLVASGRVEFVLEEAAEGTRLSVTEWSSGTVDGSMWLMPAGDLA
jgi:uncharacterized protein YndB with AHSA1/START domain